MDLTVSNASVAAALRQMAESGRIPHAMLLHQNDGGAAFPLILDFLDEVYGHNPRVRKLIHPDIHFVFPVAGQDKPVSDRFIGEWRNLLLENPCFYENELYAAIGIESKQSLISVYEARSILDKLSLSAVEGGYRTVVLYLPEKMNQQAANALLKMVEEPPEKTLFLLVTLQPEKVLTTIYSRCLFLRVRRPLFPTFSTTWWTLSCARTFSGPWRRGTQWRNWAPARSRSASAASPEKGCGTFSSSSRVYRHWPMSLRTKRRSARRRPVNCGAVSPGRRSRRWTVRFCCWSAT